MANDDNDPIEHLYIDNATARRARAIEKELERDELLSTPSPGTAAPQPQPAGGSVPPTGHVGMMLPSPLATEWGQKAGQAAITGLKGLPEVPGQAIAGALFDPYRNMMQSIVDMRDWFAHKVPGGGDILAMSDPLQMIRQGKQSFGQMLGYEPENAPPVPSTAEAVRDLIPNVAPAKGVPGQSTRVIADILGAYLPISGALGRAGMAPGFGRALLAGGLAQGIMSDPEGKNLTASLTAAFPQLQNPVTEFLASDPRDEKAVNRLRNVVEGIVTGAAIEGTMRAFKLVRAQTHAARAAQSPEELAQGLQQAQTERAQAEEFIKQAGGEEGPLVTALKTPAGTAVRHGVEKTALQKSVDQLAEAGVPPSVLAKAIVAPEGAAGTVANVTPKQLAGQLGFQVNWLRMGPDDIPAVVKDMIKAIAPGINAARGGKQSFEAQADLAHNLGLTVEDLLKRQPGQAMSGPEAIAYSSLMEGAINQLKALSHKVLSPLASDADRFALQYQAGLSQAIIQKVLGGVAESARMLNTLKQIRMKGNPLVTRYAMQSISGQLSQQISPEQLASNILKLDALGAPTGSFNRMMATSSDKFWSDVASESFSGGLLWKPTTHLTNLASTPIVAAQSALDHAAAAKLGKLLGTAVDERAVDGEALAMLDANIMGVKDAVKLGLKAFRLNESQFAKQFADLAEGAATTAKVDAPRIGAISSTRRAAQLGVDSGAYARTLPGHLWDWWGSSTRGTFRALMAEDDASKEIFKRGSYRLDAFRQATREGLQGETFARRVAEIADHPTDAMRANALDMALINTFNQRPGVWAEKLMQWRNSGSFNPLLFVAPYIRTPNNIMKNIVEHSPLGLALSGVREDLAAGGLRRDMALAKLGTGTAFWLLAIDMADRGIINGPELDQGKADIMRQQGKPPNTINIGGKAYSLRVDPVALPLIVGAAISKATKDRDLSPQDYEKISKLHAQAIGAVTRAVLDRQYLYGTAQMLDMMTDAIDRPASAIKYIDRTTNSLIPFYSLRSFTRNLGDQAIRDYNTMWDTIKNDTFLVSRDLKVARDLWGDPVEPAANAGVTLVTPHKYSPIAEEMRRLDMGVRRIQWYTPWIGGISVDLTPYPQVKDAYERYAGNENQVNGLGAKDYLNAVVTGQHMDSAAYRAAPDESKREVIRKVISGYRDAAKARILMEAPEKYPEFGKHVQELQTGMQEWQMRTTPMPEYAPLPPPQRQQPAPGPRSEAPVYRPQQTAQQLAAPAPEIDRLSAIHDILQEMRAQAGAPTEFVRDNEGRAVEIRRGKQTFGVARDGKGNISGLTAK